MILERFLANGQRAVTVRPAAQTRLIGGLPLSTAIIFVIMFVIAAYAYTILWKHVSVSIGDSSSYLEVAQDLKDLSLDQPHYRAAGYPILMLLTGSAKEPSQLLFYVQLMLNLASIWLLASILYAAGVSSLLSRLFGAVLLLPPYMESAAYALPDALTQFLLVLGLAGVVYWYQSQNRAWLIVAAIAIAYSSITSPINQALSFALVACLFAMFKILRKARIGVREIRRASLILVGSTLALVGVYSAYNYAKFHYAGATYSLGYDLGTRTARVVERLPDSYAPVRDALIKARNEQLTDPKGSHTAYQYAITAAPELQEITKLKQPELSNYLLKLNFMLIQRAPLEYLQDAAWGMASYWFPLMRGVANFKSGTIQLLWSLLHFALLGICVLQFLTFAGLKILDRSKRFAFARSGVAYEETGPRLPALPVLAYTLTAGIVIYTMLVISFLNAGLPTQRTSTESLFIFMIFLGISMWIALIRPTHTHVQQKDSVEERRKVEAWLHKEQPVQTAQVQQVIGETEQSEEPESIAEVDPTPVSSEEHPDQEPK